ncbi:MAG: multiheme c-type cytochrome [Ferruginibacter sp.]
MKKTILIIGLFASFVILLSRCMNNQLEPGKDPRGNAYAGAITCRQCHQAIYDSFLTTAHFKATSAAIAGNIQGNFDNGKNVFNYDSITKVIMEHRDSGYYQVLYKNGKQEAAYRFDVLFGNSHAQTSLYWNNDKPFELPVSWYHSANTWATSPGYSSTTPNFGRFIGTDCFECHSSGIGSKLNASVKGIEQVMKKETLIYGIDCERCHGPALAHVNYHLENPNSKTPAFLVKTNTFTQQQKLDACAVCHSGNDKMKMESRFKFKMSDTLSHFFMQRSRGNTTAFDVHGNQYNLLLESKCFLEANNLTCNTCHDPHQGSKQSLAFYSQKCMSCHKIETNNFCPQLASMGETIKTNCIDCHMPKQTSKAISFQTEGSNVQSAYLLRTHRIAVYEDSLKLQASSSKSDSKNQSLH